MSKIQIFKREEKHIQSFPNNRLSSRPRRKRQVTKRRWVEDDQTICLRVPECATFTPYTLNNPTDHTQTPNGQYEVFDVFHAGLGESLLADPLTSRGVGGWARASESAEWVGDASSMAAVNGTAQPISVPEIGHRRHSESGVGECEGTPSTIGWRVESHQVASKRSWRAPSVSSYHHHAKIRISYWSDANWKYKVSVTVTDTAGNAISDEIQIKSALAGFVDAVVNLVVGALKFVASVVMKALSFLYDIIMGMVMLILSPIIDSLNSTFNNFWAGLESKIDNLFVPHSDPKYVTDPEGATTDFLNWLFAHALVSWILIIGITLSVLETSLLWCGFGTIISAVAGAIWFVSFIKLLQSAGQRIETSEGTSSTVVASDNFYKGALGVLDASGQRVLEYTLNQLVKRKLLSSIVPSDLADAIGASSLAMAFALISLAFDNPGVNFLLLGMSALFQFAATLDLISAIASESWRTPGLFGITLMFWATGLLSLTLSYAELIA